MKSRGWWMDQAGETDMAGFILHHVFSEIQKASPGHRIEISFEDWESP